MTWYHLTSLQWPGTTSLLWNVYSSSEELTPIVVGLLFFLHINIQTQSQ